MPFSSYAGFETVSPLILLVYKDSIYFLFIFFTVPIIDDWPNNNHSIFSLLQKIIEINTRYQDKLSALRAQQANRQEELLRKESQARLSQYQQASMNHYRNTGLQDARGYSGAAATGPIGGGETPRAYASSQYESHRERPQFSGGGRAKGNEVRIPYPEGRVYNNAGARHY